MKRREREKEIGEVFVCERERGRFVCVRERQICERERCRGKCLCVCMCEREIRRDSVCVRE
jgi:hypothetical protein